MVSLPVKGARWERQYMTDSTGRRTDPLLLELTKGTHELRLEIREGSFLLGEIPRIFLRENSDQFSEREAFSLLRPAT